MSAEADHMSPSLHMTAAPSSSALDAPSPPGLERDGPTPPENDEFEVDSEFETTLASQAFVYDLHLKQDHGIKTEFGVLRTEIKGRFDATDQRLSKIEWRVDATDQRLTKIEWRVDAIDQRLTKIEWRVDAIDQRLTKIEGRVDAIDQRLKSCEADLKTITALTQSQTLAAQNTMALLQNSQVSSVTDRLSPISNSQGVVPANFPTRLWDFVRLRDDRKAGTLLALLNFYEVKGWEIWGASLSVTESEQEVMFRSVEEAAAAYPDYAIDSLRTVLGINQGALRAAQAVKVDGSPLDRKRPFNSETIEEPEQIGWNATGPYVPGPVLRDTGPPQPVFSSVTSISHPPGNQQAAVRSETGRTASTVEVLEKRPRFSQSHITSRPALSVAGPASSHPSEAQSDEKSERQRKSTSNDFLVPDSGPESFSVTTPRSRLSDDQNQDQQQASGSDRVPETVPETETLPAIFFLGGDTEPNTAITDRRSPNSDR